MRQLPIGLACVVQMVLAQVPLEASELPNRQTISRYVQQLSGQSEPLRDGAASFLLRTTWEALSLEWHNGEWKQNPATARFQQDLKSFTPEFTAVLKRGSRQPPDSATIAAMTCLAVASDDGQLLRNVISSDLRGIPQLELAAIQILATTLPYTMDGDGSAFAIVLCEIKRCSLAARHILEEIPPKLTPEGLAAARAKLSILGVAQTLVQTDSTLKEMPHLIDALNENYPACVRLCALSILAKLAEESESALPAIRGLLQDESIAIRRAAAYAVIVIHQDPSVVDKTLADSHLDRNDNGEFLKWAREYACELEHRRKELRDHPDILDRVIVQGLHSRHSFDQRQGLRMMIRYHRFPPAALDKLRDLTHSSCKVTRDLALQALHQRRRENKEPMRESKRSAGGERKPEE